MVGSSTVDSRSVDVPCSSSTSAGAEGVLGVVGVLAVMAACAGVALKNDRLRRLVLATTGGSERSVILFRDSTDDMKWTIKFSFPFTLLNIVRFSSGKSMRFRALASFSFEIMIRLLSSGKHTRPTRSFLV